MISAVVRQVQAFTSLPVSLRYRRVSVQPSSVSKQNDDVGRSMQDACVAGRQRIEGQRLSQTEKPSFMWSISQ